MAKLPFMKVFVPDLVSDTYMLSDSEFGAYWRICMALWRFKGSLPLDHQMLRKVAGATGKTWPARWAAIEHYFQIKNGAVSHSRITADLREAGAALRSDDAQSDPKTVDVRTVDGLPKESSLSDKPLESLEAVSPRAHSREPQLQPEPELDAATPSATQPLRGLEDWPNLSDRELVNAFAAGVRSPWFDPARIASPKFHLEAPSYLRRWRAAGYSWMADVLPVASAMATAEGAPIHSLKFFDPHIANAHRIRTEAPQPRGHHRDDKLARKGGNMARAADGARAALERQRLGGERGGGGD